jgi:hypothetical protein
MYPVQFDSDLGWTLKPEYVASNGRISQMDGIRTARRFTFEKPAGVLRIAAFGDSFTYGWDVSTDGAWVTLLDRMSPMIEALNFGVSGYGLDQAYLRYMRDGKKYSPDIVLIGYMSENIARHVNRYRPFYQIEVAEPYTKPRFLLKGKGLVLDPNPVRDREEILRAIDDPKPLWAKACRDDYWYERSYGVGPFDMLPSVRLFKAFWPGYVEMVKGYIGRDGRYRVSSEAYQVTERLFDLFVDEVRKAGSFPVIVIFPEGEDYHHYQATNVRRYDPLLDHFRKEGYYFIDAAEIFLAQCSNCNITDLYTYHLTPVGNRILANGIAVRLKGIAMQAVQSK